MDEKKGKKINHTEEHVQNIERISIKERRRQSKKGTLTVTLQENRSMLLIFGMIVVILAVMLMSILVLKVSAVPVCIIILLEVGIAVCLHDVPIWLHGLVFLVQLVVGILCGRILFMVLCTVIYLFGILVLDYIRG